MFSNSKNIFTVAALHVPSAVRKVRQGVVKNTAGRVSQRERQNSLQKII